jgi:TetR/AcrR family transcriptional regulator, regulator of cefoperazone and chloramphenicol sensitivity
MTGEDSGLPDFEDSHSSTIETDEVNDSLSANGAVDRDPTTVGDFTARVRIRDAALKHFAEDGYDRTTIRAIAQTAGVSHGMLRHHFGSKLALRAACDDYVFEVLHQRNSLALAKSPIGDLAQTSRKFWQYAARSLVDGSQTAAPMFNEMVMQTEQMLLDEDPRGIGQRACTGRIRAALLTAVSSVIPLFHEHLSRALGVDVLTPEGDRLVALALIDIFASRARD